MVNYVHRAGIRTAWKQSCHVRYIHPIIVYSQIGLHSSPIYLHQFGQDNPIHTHTHCCIQVKDNRAPTEVQHITLATFIYEGCEDTHPTDLKFVVQSEQVPRSSQACSPKTVCHHLNVKLYNLFPSFFNFFLKLNGTCIQMFQNVSFWFYFRPIKNNRIGTKQFTKK